MFKRASLLLSPAILSMALAGCGLFGGAESTLRADLAPTQIGFAVSDSGGITVASNNVTFRNPANASAATITGYTITIFDDDGNELLSPGDLYNDHLAIPVPAGYSCPDAESQDCAIGQRVPTPSYSEARPFVFLDDPHAAYLYGQYTDYLMGGTSEGIVRLPAEVTFSAEVRGASYSWTEGVTVTFPVEIE